MRTKKPKVRMAPQWKVTPIPERLKDCVRMLYLHDYLGDAEMRKRLGRILRDEAAGKFVEDAK